MSADVHELDGLAILAFATAAELERWLELNQNASAGVWLKLAKKDTAIDSVSYGEALEQALCFGWIDGQKRTFDERFWLQRFTPRRARSKWSRINRDKAERLIAQGRMRERGAVEIEQAKADGRWERAYASQRSATVPEDLQRELDRNPAAREFFATLNSVNRYAIVYRVDDAKRPQTRAQRIAKFVAMLEAHESIHP
jgi:uncharacterized protein YdeI (YjbR/CyaY-like superfamily)